MWLGCWRDMSHRTEAHVLRGLIKIGGSPPRVGGRLRHRFEEGRASRAREPRT